MNVFFDKKAICKARVDMFSYPYGASVGMLTVKQTFEVDLKTGKASVAAKQLDVFRQETLLRGRVFDGDVAPLKEPGTVDFVVLGDAIAPGPVPVKTMDVSIELDAFFSKQYRIFGDREWESEDPEAEAPMLYRTMRLPSGLLKPAEEMADLPSPAALPVFPSRQDDFDPAANAGDEKSGSPDDPRTFRMTEALEFTRMPITWENAFGGTDCMYGVPYPDNPDGKGYIMVPTDDKDYPLAAGVELPNVEDASCVISSWRDNPAPAGCSFYPMSFGKRIKAGLEMPAGGGPFRQPVMLGRLFNQAFPDLILKDFPDGRNLQVTGMTPSEGTSPGVFRTLVRKPALRARLEEQSGAPVSDPGLALAWDLVCVVPEDSLYYVVGRAAWTWDPKSDARRNVRVISR